MKEEDSFFYILKNPPFITAYTKLESAYAHWIGVLDFSSSVCPTLNSKSKSVKSNRAKAPVKFVLNGEFVVLSLKISIEPGSPLF